MSGSDNFLQGMDVSKWQTTTPSLVGVHYLIARRGIGTKPDLMYPTHIAAAKAAGIDTGSYWYGIGDAIGLTVAEEVAAYIASEGDVKYHALDWEGADGFTAAQAADFIRQYKAATGNRIALYASEGRFRDLGQDWDWVANYSQEPLKHYDVWQYGPFHGADGDNYRGTLSDLRALSGITEKPMRSFTLNGKETFGTLVVNGPDHWYLRLRTNVMNGPINPTTFGARRAMGPVTLTDGGVTPTDPRNVGYIVGTEAAFLLKDDVTFKPEVVVAPVVVDTTPFDQAYVDKAVDSAVATTLAGQDVLIKAALATGTRNERERLALAEAARIREL